MENQKKVLVVDDDPVSLKMLSVRLEVNNFTAITAQDGEEAVEKVKQDKPDAIVLDLMLPKMSGYEVCSMLKFDDNYKDIPIIVLSSLHEQEERDKAIKSGADAYFIKPFDLELLLVKIKDFLG